MKGFCPYVITSPELFYAFLEEARNLRANTNATRITLRFVTSPDYRLWLPTQPDGYYTSLETTAIPLFGRWRGHRVQYFGENSVQRIEPKDVIEKEHRIVFESLSRANQRDPFLKPNQNGYQLQIGIGNDRDIKQLHELYNAVYRDYVFHLTLENVTELVENPKSITATARSTDGRIASVAIAEVVEIPTNKGLLKISEISDEATHPHHRGNGLNQACVHSLTRELIKTYGEEIHLIYAEDRATSRGVNQQSANLGWVYDGRLNRHCRIDADRDIEVEGPHEDLNVWHFPR